MRTTLSVCLVLLAAISLCLVPRPMQIGRLPGGGYLVATGQAVRPAGQTVEFGGRPVDLALSPDQRTLYVKDNRGIVVIDVGVVSARPKAEAGPLRILQELKFPAGGGSMHGIAVSRDGLHVYATTAQVHLFEASVRPDRTLAWSRTISLPGPGGKGDSHPCGIALSADGARAYVCLSRNNSLGIVDLKEGRRKTEIPVGVAPWDVALSPDGRTAYVSNWGGKRPAKGESTAQSSGTDTLIDERGIASSGTVSFVNLAIAKETVQVVTGLHPCDIELTADGKTLYVANANSDSVSVIDTVTRRAGQPISMRPDPILPFGSAPTGLALSGTDKLYVTFGGNNAVALVVPSSRRVSGYIPAGWYPGAVVAAGSRLYIANVKGTGFEKKPSAAKAFNTHQHVGMVQAVPMPSTEELRAFTQQVRADARVQEAMRASDGLISPRRTVPAPVPNRIGEPSVFQHVVYIIKENRTYDQVFGDLPQGNGDPSLCIYGREVTPNHHALAEQFVLLDNFYCNGVLSADGHSWATEGNVTDHLEKSFGGFTRSYTFGDDPLTYSSSGFLWNNALGHGRSFRNYGEMDYAEPIPKGDFKAIYRDYQEKTGKFSFKQSIGIEPLRKLSCRQYPGWNTGVPDVLRADVFLKELKEAETVGRWPNLAIVYLCNDHTSGTSPAYPTPRAQVADNDLALGRIVEGISKSRFWSKTCIFVVEDDPQDGFDHVDGHRSPALVVSPYTKRGAVIHEFYNQTSVLHTMEQILGLPPMNQLDALAPLMRECFTARPDLRPYTAAPNRIALDEMNPPITALRGKARELAHKSLALDLKRPDEADEDTLNRILWHAAKGPNARYPARLAGDESPAYSRSSLRD